MIPGGGINLDVPPSNLIDLDCWQNGLTAAVKSKIYEILESYIDPCDPEGINNIINNILIEACTERSENSAGSDNSFLETLEDAVFGQGILDRISSKLEGVDYIIPYPSLNKSCPKALCILEKMLNGPLGTRFVCDLLAPFNGENGENQGLGFHLLIGAQDFINDGIPETLPTANALTTIGENTGNRPFILLNSNNCDNINLMNIFDTFQHEFIHASIYQELKNMGWNGSNISEGDAFHQYVMQKYGIQNPTTTQHQLILDYFVDLMVNSLIEANNGIGSFEDFEGLVLNGFGEDVLIYCGISLSELQEKYQNHLNFINNPSNVGGFFKNCN